MYETHFYFIVKFCRRVVDTYAWIIVLLWKNVAEMLCKIWNSGNYKEHVLQIIYQQMYFMSVS